jgi:hypothetical protein
MPEWLEISVVHFIDVILICYIIFLREQSWYKIHLTKQDFDSSTLTFLTSWYASISLIMNHQQIPILQRCWKQYKKDINHQHWKKETWMAIGRDRGGTCRNATACHLIWEEARSIGYSSSELFVIYSHRRRWVQRGVEAIALFESYDGKRWACNTNEGVQGLRKFELQECLFVWKIN